MNVENEIVKMKIQFRQRYSFFYFLQKKQYRIYARYKEVFGINP